IACSMSAVPIIVTRKRTSREVRVVPTVEKRLEAASGEGVGHTNGLRPDRAEAYIAISQEADHETCSDRHWAACDDRCSLCRRRLLLSLIGGGLFRPRYSPGAITIFERFGSTEKSAIEVRAAPISCATMKPGTWFIAIPAKVVV